MVNGNDAFKLKYKECWPKTISSIELNHSTQNTPVRMTVEMQYAYWESDDIATNGIGRSVTPKNSASTGGPAGTP